MRFAITLLSLALLAGCDQVNQRLGLEDPAKKEAKTAAEGQAVGSACRQSGRAIEDCYAIYSWLPKSPIFEGWREMDTYMRDNNIETVAPQLPPPEPPGLRRTKKPASKESTAVPEIKIEKTADPVVETVVDKAGEEASTPPAEKANAAR